MSIGRDGQLRTTLYDKSDDFNFHITNFPFLSSNIPSLPAYGVFITQLMACSSYECFILRAVRLSSKLLDRDMSENIWNRSSGSSKVVMGISSNIMKSPSPKCYMTFCDIGQDQVDTVIPSTDQTLHQFVHLLPNWTLLPIWPIFGGFHRTLQRVQLANRGRLLLRTPGSIPFGTCICSNVETIFSWTCHVFGLWILNIPRVLLFSILP